MSKRSNNTWTQKKKKIQNKYSSGCLPILNIIQVSLDHTKKFQTGIYFPQSQRAHNSQNHKQTQCHNPEPKHIPCLRKAG